MKPKATPSSNTYPATMSALLVLAAALPVGGTFRLFSSSSELVRTNPDVYQVGRQVERFAAAKALLPPSGTIGYLTDVPPPGNRGEYALTSAQYALAPLVVVMAKPGQTPEYAIGNFGDAPPDPAAAGRELGYELLRDTGANVLVFRRRK